MGETTEHRADSRSSVVILLIGTFAIALTIVWWVSNIVPATVHSDADLQDVVFGWPIPWYHQDISRYGGFVFPVELTTYGDRANPVPTAVDWGLLAANTAIVGVVVWAVLRMLISLGWQASDRRAARADHDLG